MNLSYDLLLDLAVILVLIGAFRQFRTPHGARRGNLTAMAAMMCALLLVLVRHHLLSPATVVAAVIAGGALGYAIAIRVNMIQIPALIAFQHGAGGVAAFLVSYVELTRETGNMAALNELSGTIGIVIGAATFSGSMIAGGKLANLIRQTPQYVSGHGSWLLAHVAAIAILGLFSMDSSAAAIRYDLVGLIALSISLGVLFSMRIGGADMPVLISFLNATAGLAAAFCGIIIENRLLIACGATVAASGSILTHVMCRAMNRSLLKVFWGSAIKSVRMVPMEKTQDAISSASPPLIAPASAETSPDENLERVTSAAKSAEKVVIIPGYGMAIAQAQFEVVSFAKKLIEMGKEVKFAIHPVAGRMPGHMNVLLAEADVDYEMLYEIDDVNPGFCRTDFVLIVGACDVVNPAAIHKEGTPISGMPILLAHEAKNVVVCNLDRRPGYSGVENPLYNNENTILMLGDAKKTVGMILENMI
ncbi:MAG: NAD(P)(+) transhydrogenase (Re/Si-specific) subunit beta [Pseudomonadota bacterium]